MEKNTTIKLMLNTLYGVRPQEAAIANKCLCYQMAVYRSQQRLRIVGGPNSRIIYADTDSVKCVAMDD